ncbi:hypothetical protein F5B22DRAFT_111818 [Xylaria bambusicola]|uniref:uncharacterized protein n=1 Tax=Xylaria bambusicola TaxID=326684 RepID=UPI002007BED0|nr:uncharacterized protein F5B22DRAFT_111818 [Xylaria bambusicola]KAI0517626.1 hypothetical protein F5B22DRAFT_111818 [Xylaria bambusicola]
MEDILLMPPDRGPILGKPVWKPRYVVLGSLSYKEGHQPNLSLSQVLSNARMRDVGGRASRSQLKGLTDATYLSVYKSKEDKEPICQHSITSITDCQVRQVAHRKQGHIPTLTIQISPDPATDKLRKRRSSRSGGLIATKDSGPSTLLFLTTEGSQYSLDDWARNIQTLVQRQQSMPMSPISPSSPTFISPFSPVPDIAEKSSPASSAKGKLKSKLQTKSSGRAIPLSREPSSVYAPGSPSLRSRTSDLSSQASSMVPAAMNFVQQHYANLQNSELPSPAATVDEYPEQLIEGWTMAQGRSSTLSSPIMGRASISSSQGPSQPSLESSPPIVPRETILDRAFQMRCIPGSDREVAGEEKLTSLARFEALMRETENRQKIVRSKETKLEPLRSTWDDESDEDDDEFGREVDDDDEDSDDYAFEDGGHDGMDATTFKALRFITNRHNSTYSESGLRNAPSVSRPHTSHSRSRPTAQRTSSQPYIPGPPFHIPSSPPLRQTENLAMRRSNEKRHSTSEMKNLSFNEFTKRLSGTSSLLIQSNASTGSNRGSGDYDTHTPRGSMSPRGPSQTSDERCRWRGSIGVIGNEGGFL